MTKKSYNDDTIQFYTYNGEGFVNGIGDTASGRNYGYEYDVLGRLVQFKQSDSSGLLQFGGNSFDSENRISKFSYVIPGITPETGRFQTYSYNATNGSLSSLRTAAGDIVGYSYDAFNRVSAQTLGNVNTTYGYIANGKSESTQVAWKQIKIGSQSASKLEYGYDSLGNIKSVFNGYDNFQSLYTYDNQNQLTAEVIGNSAIRRNYSYRYDTFGNIREKSYVQDGKTVKNTYTYLLPFITTPLVGYLFLLFGVTSNLLAPNFVSSHFGVLLLNNNLRHIRFHELRHTCASLLAANGLSIKLIQLYMGHSNYSTTADVYSHLDYKAQQESAAMMEQILG